MKKTTLQIMVTDGDIDKIRNRIEVKYGFTPTDEYILDLMDFVNTMVSRMPDESSFSRANDYVISNK